MIAECLPTAQDKMRETLARSGIPAKSIKCYGSQITITAWSEDAARKWADLLSKFAKVRGPVAVAEDNKINQNTMLNPTSHVVWRIAGTV